MHSIKTKKLLAIGLFSVLFLVTRIPFLGFDEINPDAVNWHYRSEQFIVGLKSGDFLKTYQHYHPGVTLSWIMGVPIELARQIHPAYRVYTQDNFLQLHQIAKYTLVLVQLALTVVLIFGLKNILGFKKSLAAVTVFSLEPFFLGNSRLLHMDVLLALLMLLALTFSFRYITTKWVWHIVLSGVFAGLAFLTKSVGALTVGCVAVFLLANSLKNIKAIVIFGLAFGVTTFALFPALWVNPGFVLSNMYTEGVRVGIRNGHDQVILGEETDSAGPWFYPIVLAMKTSPVIWLGVGLFLWQVIKNRSRYEQVDKHYILYLTLCYLMYFLGMSLVSKKVDRYMIPVFPLLGIISAVSITEILSRANDRYKRSTLHVLFVLILAFGIIYPLVKFYPYYFTYTNPLFGSAEQANKLIGQKPFGMGIPELKKLIVQKYGANLVLGFIDKKPMSMIYKNSRLYDIREYDADRIDLIILGPNEVMPTNVAKGNYVFNQDGAMYINGLEFWRIYKKSG